MLPCKEVESILLKNKYIFLFSSIYICIYISLRLKMIYHNQIKNSKTQSLKEKFMTIKSQLKPVMKKHNIIFSFIFIKNEYIKVHEIKKMILTIKLIFHLSSETKKNYFFS